jgi:hypothetical protein
MPRRDLTIGEDVWRSVFWLGGAKTAARQLLS